MADHQKYLLLNRTGNKIPLIGFGTARIPVEDTEQVVYNAIKTGYRLIDCALLYGNEPQVGKAVRRAIDEGIVKREDLFVIGKLWNSYHSKENVRPIFEMTHKNYGLDYLDLYLIHFPIPTVYVDPKKHVGFKTPEGEFKLEKSPMQECWKEMERLVDDGLVRNIGISNFNVQAIVDLLTYARIRPAVLEIEHHPYLQQKRLIDWVKQEGIQVIAYASFGSAAFEETPRHLKHLPNLMDHPVIQKIANKYKLNPGQILLAWATQREIIVIPKTVNEDRMEINLKAPQIKLDEQDFKDIAELEAHARFNDFFEENYGFDFPAFD
ncbi:4-dihydromethyl-trisporate dehydrogenase [Cokeromyces recurvatus]|uniref:4-dihydromethyl-trisporate dehydrogenase n=1 Tax=Cokeromyces recurvatus TaxID=90255 RepID=UPI00221F55EA|nr:4-dihydromethyl-trisporate dehydrogenase [Cokeromyces recurvatus]KAI7898115.1 4-dihydromethyl-trisporate dehydrogenase [Cokeromyces recurvatus]